jgi:hypothetical protein
MPVKDPFKKFSLPTESTKEKTLTKEKPLPKVEKTPLEEMNEILTECGGQESNVPVNSKYWDLKRLLVQE